MEKKKCLNFATGGHHNFKILSIAVIYECVILTLDLFMNHQSKVIGLKDARKLPQVISQADLREET